MTDGARIGTFLEAFMASPTIGAHPVEHDGWRAADIVTLPDGTRAEVTAEPANWTHEPEHPES